MYNIIDIDTVGHADIGVDIYVLSRAQRIVYVYEAALRPSRCDAARESAIALKRIG